MSRSVGESSVPLHEPRESGATPRHHAGMAATTREEKILLGLLRLPSGGSGAEEAGLPGAIGVLWDVVLEIATPLLHPWLHHRLSGAWGWGAPAPVLDRLAAARRANALLQVRRREELRGILAAFGRERVPVVVLKGMALASLAYPDPSLRPMLDIDLLVPAPSLLRAREILGGLGFRVPMRHAYRPESGATAMAESSKPMQRPGTRMMVDMHGELDPRDGGAPREWEAGLLERAVPADLNGLPAMVPSMEDLLVHTCRHLSERHHFDRGLPPLLDVALLLDRRGPDMKREVLVRQAELPGGREAFLLPLRLARDLLGAAVPDDLLARWPRDDRMEELERLASEQVLRTGKDHVSPGLVEIAMQPPARRLTHLLHRLNPWRVEDRRSGSDAASIAKAGGKAARRLGADLLTRARIYAGALRRGDLTRENVARAIRLRQGRDRIAKLIEEASRQDEISPRPPRDHE